MEFKDKVILITGASSGIGRATAIAFSEEGGTVVVSDINKKGGLETVEIITSKGGNACFIEANVADFNSVENLIQQIVDKYNRLDVAINNAGVGGDNAKLVDTTLDSWHHVMSINASGVFYCLKSQIPVMLKQSSGAIVNIASIAGLKGLPNSLPYVASKHAVVGMTKTAAMEYAKHNIRVNAVCPVFTVTPLFNPDLLEEKAPGIPDKLKANVPMKRFANVSEQVNAILWLASDKASFVTGHAMPVDGGLTA